MAKPEKKQTARLKRRQAAFDATKSKQGMKRPGSMNSHKSASSGRVKTKRK